MADQTIYQEVHGKQDLNSSTMDASSGSNKRKRSSLDQGAGNNRPSSRGYQRVSPGSANNVDNTADLNDQTASFLHNTSAGNDETSNTLDFSSLTHNSGDHGLHPNGSGSNNAGDTAAAALAHYTMTVPQSTEMAFQNQATGNDNSQSFSMGDPSVHQQSSHIPDFSGLEALKANSTPSQAAAQKESASSNTTPHKPPVGSEEWHKVRRDNHKEVERRRRETINEGINELAKIVPGCEKNKGSILQRAVQFITQLKENETQNIEKWTLEKLLTEQAITELSTSCDKFKTECQRAWEEVEMWKRTCQNAGLVPDELKNQDAGDVQGAES